MRFLKNIDTKTYGKVEVWSATRGGSMSPISFYLRQPGSKRWIVPYQYEPLGEVSIGFLMLYEFYSGPIKELIYAEIPIFKNIIPNTSKDVWTGNYIPISKLKIAP